MLEQRLEINYKGYTNSKFRTARKIPCGLLFAVFILIFVFSPKVFPAEEDQSDAESQKPIQERKISISTGSGGKVIWLLDKNLGTAHGNAIVQYDDVTLKADHIWADMDAEVIEAKGDVRLETKDQNIAAESMIFDLRKKKGIMIDGVSLDVPWYYSGKQMSRFNSEESFIKHGSMTSCSLNNPHYSFEASKIIIHLKKEMVAKNVVFKVGGIPLLYLPVYRRSLEPDKRSRFIFKIGSNTFEGYYVKNILPIRWRMLDGSVFLNYTSRRGATGGLEFDYDADKVKLREIFIPVPKDASSEEWQTARERINEILQRAEGELDKVWLKQIFIRFNIGEAEKEKTFERARSVLSECREENANFSRLARRYSDDKDTKSIGGDLGSFVLDEKGIRRKEKEELKPVESRLLPIIETAFELEQGAISDLIETEEGYHIVKVESKEDNEIRVRDIFIRFDASEAAQQEAQNKADEILTKLSEGGSFDELAKTYSDDTKTRDKGGDLGWKVFQDFNLEFRNTVRRLEKGGISRPIIGSLGVYILKLEDKERTPSFSELAQNYSQSPSAKEGGDLGFKSKWELPSEVRREAYRLEIYNISKPIKSEDGYRIIKIDKKRRLGGDVFMRYGDLYSYQTEKNPIKMGQTWNFEINHNQTLWRGGEQLEEDATTLQERLRLQKSLGMRARLSLSGEEYKQVYQSYTPERELKSYCGFDYYWMSKTGSSGHARFIVDGTRDLLGADTSQLQKYPEVSYNSPSYRLYEIQPFKRINAGLRSISSRIQGKADFASMARKVSDDLKTKDKGGDLGWINKQASGLNSRIEAKLFSSSELDPGEVSEPISLSDGYYIVKVEEIEEEFGKRKRVKARQIFISIDPKIRTKDEASKLADDVYRELTEGERPSLGFLTLDNSLLSFDTEVGNYYKDSYITTNEKNIWLQTADAGVTLSKRAIIRLGINRELNLDVNGNYRQIWHSKSRPLLERDLEEWELDRVGERDKNIFSNAWNVSTTLSTNLHRTYHPNFIPKVYAMRHTVNPYVRFYYAPPSESEEREGEKRPPLYPFGAATWTFERKQLDAGMTNGIDIKTKLKRERISLLRWDFRTSIDYTEEPGRRYRDTRNTFTLTPHKRLELSTVLVHDLNHLNTDDPLLSRFSSDVRYSDAEGRWSGYLSRQYIYNTWKKEWQQFFRSSVNLRWSKDWRLNVTLEYEYDKQVKDIREINISLDRKLHCWESRIGFVRRGTKGGYIRKDFFFQIDIMADPGKALGVGYDDISKSWVLRTLPGMGRLGAYTGRYMEY